MKGGALPAEIIARFRSVALERLERLESAWAILIKREGNAEFLASAHHELHTLKGDSRVVGFNDINLLCHKLEELLSLASRRSFHVPDDFDLVATMAIRFMAMLLRKKEGASLGGIDVEGFVLQIDEVLADVRVRSVPPPSYAQRAVKPVAVAVETPDRVSSATQQRLAVAATQVFLEHLRSSGAPRERLRDVWLSLSSQIAAFYSLSLYTMLARHEEAAQALARDLGKEVCVTLDLDDVSLRMDAAEAVDTAVIHAIRNAVDHGVEDPVARREAGKSPVGRIIMEARVVGDSVEVSVEDDGRGVDLEEVRRRGVTLGFLSHEDADVVTPTELVDLLFRPGFSTKTSVSDVSGRGIGLDAVRTALTRAGGKIELSTLEGQGTKVVVRVPQAGRHLPARCFKAQGVDLLIAVPEAWAISPGGDADKEEAIDLLGALDVTPARTQNETQNEAQNEAQNETTAEAAAGSGVTADEKAAEIRGDTVLRLRKGSRTIALRVGGAPFTCIAERLCPTGDEHPVEVVLLNGTEGLLLRPELLSKLGAHQKM